MAKIATLIDDFASGSKNTAKWKATPDLLGHNAFDTLGDTSTQSGGKLILSTTDSVQCTGAYSSNDTTLDLTSSAAYFEITDPPIVQSEFCFNISDPAMGPGGSGAMVFWRLLYDGTNYTLNAECNFFGTGGVPYSATFSPTAHRWLRIRDDGTDIYWETSPDGSAWTIRRAMSAGASPPSYYAFTSAACGLYLNNYSSPAKIGVSMGVDNFNTVSAPAPPPPPPPPVSYPIRSEMYF